LIPAQLADLSAQNAELKQMLLIQQNGAQVRRQVSGGEPATLLMKPACLPAGSLADLTALEELLKSGNNEDKENVVKIILILIK